MERPIRKASKQHERRCDLVFEGGGVKGIGLAGAFSVLDEQGYQPQNVAGASAGAITAALVAAGYHGEELKKLVLELDFNQFKDSGWEDKIPLIGWALSLLRDQGIYEGKYFGEWMEEKLAVKGVRTFADLRTESADPRWNFRLQVIVSDLTSRRLLVLPKDAGLLGLDPLELKVADAVRMSMSIPVFFEPVKVMNRQTKQEHQLVDGGLLSNFPVWLFDSEGEVPAWPTFGLLLVEPEPTKPLQVQLPGHGPSGLRDLKRLLKGLVQTLLEAHDRLYLERAQFVRTITIETLGIRTTEFDINPDRALELYNSGRTAAKEFLSKWDFDAYLKVFRSGKPYPPRRESVYQEVQHAASGMAHA